MPKPTAQPHGSLSPGKVPDFPEKALRADLARVRHKVGMIRTDQTTADTRLADYLLDLNPATTNGLTNLTLAAISRVAEFGCCTAGSAISIP